MAKLFLTDRVLDDLVDIHDYSTEQFGQTVADRYIQQYDLAFQALRDGPRLLREREDYPGPLRFYRVKQHWLVCDLIDDRIFVLTVKHGSVDMPARLAELEPQLQQEVAVVRRRINKQRK